MITVFVALSVLGCLFFAAASVRFIKQWKQQELEMAELRERRRQERLQQLQQVAEIAGLELGLSRDARIGTIMKAFQFQTINRKVDDNQETIQDPGSKSHHSQGTSLTVPVDEETNESVLPGASPKSQSTSTTYDDSEDCCICLDSCYGHGQVICSAKTKECDHVFHQDCAIQWFQDHDQCPLCRATLIIQATVDGSSEMMERGQNQ